MHVSRTPFSSLSAGWRSWCLVAAALLGAAGASAQTPPASATAPAAVQADAAAPTLQRRVQVGDATGSLLAQQRAAAGAPRPITADQAGLSYQRYLESFKYPIPQYLDSSVGRSPTTK